MSETFAPLAAGLADRYRIERELGQGGMATVYLAEDVRHHRRVAVKVLRPELAAVIGAERFVREIQTIAALQHPHILGLIDSGEVQGTAYYVMPFVDGESLRDRLMREKQLPIADALRIATEVASALDYAHRHGVIHRDIKPENILLHDGQALVADFGIALAVSQAGGSRMTETGMSLGTPHYMSPEQAMGEREITARSDVYALGCVTYEMLLGEPPFTGPTAQAIVAKVVTEEPRPLTIQRRSVPEHVEAAVLTALAKLPADRFGTAAEFAKALGGAQTDGMTRSRLSTRGSRTRNARDRTWNARRVIGALVLVALGVAAGLLLRRPTPPAVARLNIRFPPAEGLRAAPTLMLAISPDGSRIAYTGPDSVGWQIWVRELSSLTGRPIPGTHGALSPVFSPDGRALAFFTGDLGDLRIASIDGGSIQTVVRDSARPFGAYWTDDGMIYFGVVHGGLAKVRIGGGAYTVLSRVDSTTGVTEHNFPHVLPDGKRALIQVWRSTLLDCTIGIMDLGTGTITPIAEGIGGVVSPTGDVIFATAAGGIFALPLEGVTSKSPRLPVSLGEGIQIDPLSGTAEFALSKSGTLLYVTGTGGGQASVVWVDRSGRVTPIDPSWHIVISNLASVAISPDGHRLAYSQVGSGGEQIWVRDLRTSVTTRVSFGKGANLRAVWTPDGRSLAFMSTRSGRRQAWLQRADGSAEAESLLADPRQVDEIAFAPGGKAYLVRRGSGGSQTRDLFWKGGADSALRPLVTSSFDEYSGTLSPDGRWFAYVSLESGREEVYVRSVADPGGGKWQISASGGSEPRWAHSGREIFFRSGRGTMLAAAVTIGSGFSSGTPRVLFTNDVVLVGDHYPTYDVSRDDRRFVMFQRAGGEPETIVVLNWFEELRQVKR